MKAKKRLITMLLALSMSLLALTVHARESQLPTGFLIGDSNGIYVTADGEYFMYITDMRPGDKIYKTLTIQNNESSGSYRLSMTSIPLSTTGPIDLQESIHLTLKLEGKTIYDGRVRGDEGVNMVLNALDLGVYRAGDTRSMEIYLVLDETLPRSKFYEKSVAEVKWQFIAIKDEEAAPPKTGEIVNRVVEILSLTAAVLSVIIFVFAYKKKRETCAVDIHEKQ